MLHMRGSVNLARDHMNPHYKGEHMAANTSTAEKPLIEATEHAQLIKLTFADWLDMPPVYLTERQIMELTDQMRLVVFTLRLRRR